MRVRGTLTVEGIKLHVDVEAPDHQKELFVTNVHPSCLVIPRERWKIEYLGFTDRTVAELRAKGIATLDNMLDSEWSLDPREMSGLSDAAREEVERTLEEFREIALIFDMPRQGKEAKRERVASVAPPINMKELATRNDVLDESVSVLGLPQEVMEILKKRHGVECVRDLVALDRDQLIMTPKMDEKNIRRIEEQLAKRGLYL